ncbi:hypothetical protein [Lysinibacillus sphaericus]|uniref:Uncharacterized protein n=1 Tax=Lysinibacillus sphaericus OT4b.31 TaxID=1285586 RepID=R7ZIC1_LYSSH|nr:hypothetical protein [Lysinibacillus sphaericus]EON73840.1 hypothetical protein H131_04224 [Lysinibacillus sphaericus OT4b.31]
MTLDELKSLFKKQIPAAYESLKEAEAMPEGEAKRYKISAALQTIGQVQDILTSCWDELRFKDGLILAHRAENVPREHTARIFYDYAHVEPERAIHNLQALEGISYKKLYKILSTQENDLEHLEAERQRSMAERIKAREQRIKG